MLKNIKYVFGMCVLDCKKMLIKIQNNYILIQGREHGGPINQEREHG